MREVKTMVSKGQHRKCAKCAAWSFCLIWGRPGGEEKTKDTIRDLRVRLAAFRACNVKPTKEGRR